MNNYRLQWNGWQRKWYFVISHAFSSINQENWLFFCIATSLLFFFFIFILIFFLNLHQIRRWGNYQTENMQNHSCKQRKWYYVRDNRWKYCTQMANVQTFVSRSIIPIHYEQIACVHNFEPSKSRTEITHKNTKFGARQLTLSAKIQTNVLHEFQYHNPYLCSECERVNCQHYSALRCKQNVRMVLLPKHLSFIRNSIGIARKIHTFRN